MHVETNDSLIVSNASEYLQKMHKFRSAKKEEEWIDKNSEMFSHIGKIISTEVAIFLFRRCGGTDFCASVIDDMIAVRRKLIIKFEKKFGTWLDYNHDAMF